MKKLLVMAALSAAAIVGMGAPISAVDASSHQARVVQTPVPQQRQQAPVQNVSVDEADRLRRLGRPGTGRHQRIWDGKNRSGGDRAHKRWKRSRH